MPINKLQEAEEAQFIEVSPGNDPKTLILSHSLLFFLDGFSFACIKFMFHQSGIDGLGGLKLTYGTRAPGTTFRTRKDDKVILLLFMKNN